MCNCAIIILIIKATLLIIYLFVNLLSWFVCRLLTCTSCGLMFEMDIFCSAAKCVGRGKKRWQGGKENGYLYLLAPELLSQIPRGSLTQCSTNWCSWRSGRVIWRRRRTLSVRQVGSYLKSVCLQLSFLLLFFYKHYLICRLWCHIILFKTSLACSP